MFYYISGNIALKGADFAVIDAGGVGYKINTSLFSLANMGDVGEKGKMYTYTYVREDAFEIFGFHTNEELSLFTLLIGVSGVGPKAAISLLSCLSPSELSLAIVSTDAKSICRAQGVGPKAAQRIILDLKDKISNEQLVFNDKTVSASAVISAPVSSEAIEALCVLGYSPSDATAALSGLDLNRDLELVIRDALKKLAK